MKNAQQIKFGQGHFKLTEILIYKKIHNNNGLTAVSQNVRPYAETSEGACLPSELGIYMRTKSEGGIHLS